jgi:hypothetical protein
MEWIKSKIDKKYIFGFNSYMITNDEGTVAITKKFHANLIASAPEMLELLKKCYTGEIEEPYNNDELNDLISKATKWNQQQKKGE